MRDSEDAGAGLPKVSWATPTTQRDTAVTLLLQNRRHSHGAKDPPSSSETSRISSTVSGKLIQCFSVVT